MTTATKRLRRASIAGLATIATVGGALMATGGTALAFVATVSPGTTAAVLAGGSSASLAVGGSNQALGDVTLAFKDNTTTPAWTAGEQITFTLSDIKGAALSNTTTSAFNTISFAAAPTVSVNNGVTAPAATAALSSSTNGNNDEFVVTFNGAAPLDTNTTTVTLSGLKVNLGSTLAAGNTVYIAATTTTPATNIFWVINPGTNDTAAPATVAGSQAVSGTETVAVGTIPQASLTASKVAVANPSSSVNLGVLSITDVNGGILAAGATYTLTLSGGTWTTAPTATGLPALSTAPAIATATTVTFTVGGTASAKGNVLTLTGGVATTPAGFAKITATLSGAGISGVAPIAQVISVVQQSRVGGSDRYATGAQLYAKGGPAGTGFTGTAAVLTSGTNYPDALSAQFLAKQLAGAGAWTVGVLTTDPGSLSVATQQILLSHAVTTVYIVGGTAAVSQKVQDQVAALHVSNTPINANINVVRIGGADRYSTNNLVDLYLGVTGNSTAYVAVGSNFADALAIGPAVYNQGTPLVLTDGASLSASAQATIQNLGITRVIILGGTSAVSTAVETALTNLGVTVAYRIAGADRTTTAAQIATYETGGAAALPASGAYAALTGLGFDDSNVYIARGDNFADALVAGPVAGSAATHVGQPILLTGDPNTLGAGIPSFLGGKAGTTQTLTALGLTSAVSVTTLGAAAASLS